MLYHKYSDLGYYRTVLSGSLQSVAMPPSFISPHHQLQHACVALGLSEFYSAELPALRDNLSLQPISVAVEHEKEQLQFNQNITKESRG